MSCGGNRLPCSPSVTFETVNWLWWTRTEAGDAWTRLAVSPELHRRCRPRFSISCGVNSVAKRFCSDIFSLTYSLRKKLFQLARSLTIFVTDGLWADNPCPRNQSKAQKSNNRGPVFNNRRYPLALYWLLLRGRELQCSRPGSFCFHCLKTVVKYTDVTNIILSTNKQCRSEGKSYIKNTWKWEEETRQKIPKNL